MHLSQPQIILGLVALAIPILPNLWSIWDVFHKDFSTPAEKIGWVFAAMFLPVVGGIAYIFLGRKRGIKMLD